MIEFKGGVPSREIKVERPKYFDQILRILITREDETRTARALQIYRDAIAGWSTSHEVADWLSNNKQFDGWRKEDFQALIDECEKGRAERKPKS